MASMRLAAQSVRPCTVWVYIMRLHDVVLYISNCRVNPAPREILEFDCISLITIDAYVLPSANEKAIQWSKVTQLATAGHSQRRELGQLGISSW